MENLKAYKKVMKKLAPYPMTDLNGQSASIVAVKIDVNALYCPNAASNG